MDFSKITDEDLLRLILHRQEAALSELYDRYGRLAYSLALNVLGDPASAEEVTQDVFLRIWERAETFQAGQGKLVTWLARIARNRAIDQLRRRKVRPEGNSLGWDELTGAEPTDGQSVEQVVELNQQSLRLRRAIAQLPDEQKEVLTLAYFQGLSHQEMADALGQPLGTVKTRVRLAMQKLKIYLSD